MAPPNQAWRLQSGLSARDGATEALPPRRCQRAKRTAAQIPTARPHGLTGSDKWVPWSVSDARAAQQTVALWKRLSRNCVTAWGGGTPGSRLQEVANATASRVFFYSSFVYFFGATEAETRWNIANVLWDGLCRKMCLSWKEPTGAANEQLASVLKWNNGSFYIYEPKTSWLSFFAFFWLTYSRFFIGYSLKETRAKPASRSCPHASWFSEEDKLTQCIVAAYFELFWNCSLVITHQSTHFVTACSHLNIKTFKMQKWLKNNRLKNNPSPNPRVQHQQQQQNIHYFNTSMYRFS